MPGEGDRATTVLLVVNGTEVVVDRVDARAPDLSLVDALARLQLEARRRGAQVVLRDPTAALRGLLELVGLGGGVLVLEARGKAEGGEELAADEVVQPRDLPG